jgi:hypothetical protein
MVAAAVKGIVVINLAIAVLTLGRWRRRIGVINPNMKLMNKKIK